MKFLKEIDLSIPKNTFTSIIAPSGAGKSTLLKTLVGQLSALNGSFSFSEQVKLRYFEQDLHWENEEKTPIQIVSDCYPSLTIKEVRKNTSLLWNYGRTRNAGYWHIKRWRTGKGKDMPVNSYSL